MPAAPAFKFQVFAVEGEGGLRRQIKSQMDGIGSRPRLRASGPTGDPLADRAYPIEAAADVPAAMAVAGAWLRDHVHVSIFATNVSVRTRGDFLNEIPRILPKNVAKFIAPFRIDLDQLLASAGIIRVGRRP